VEEKPSYAELEQRVKELEKEAKKLKQEEKALRKRGEELEVKADSMEQSNKALRTLLKQRDEARDGIEEKVVANVQELVLPFVRNLKGSELDDKQMINVDREEPPEHYLAVFSNPIHKIPEPYPPGDPGCGAYKGGQEQQGNFRCDESVEAHHRGS